MTIYIHIPFCIKKCSYCDFYSLEICTKSIASKKSITPNIINSYINSLCKELELKSQINPKNTQEITSIFFGGGTPTCIADIHLEQIFRAINKYYNVARNCEVTIEANPATNINFSKLREIGFNRISIGVQSFIEAELLFLGRLHDADLAKRTIIEAKKYFNNINIDLIFSLPNQTKSSLLETLKIAASLDIQHISVYSLIYEQGTKIHNLLENNIVKSKTEYEDAELYEKIYTFLIEQKYLHYEISNFARVNFECKHNLNYWQRGEYLGIGASAHSFVANQRFSNYNDIYKYCDLLSNDILATNALEILNNNEILDEYIFLGLRSSGIDLSNFSSCVYELCEQYEKLGYGKIANNIFKLTSAGYFLCDEVVLNILKRL